MPLVINDDTEESLSYEEFSEMLYASGVDVSDEEQALTLAPLLKKISNNKTFLADRITSELKDYNKFQEHNSYSSQVIMLEHSKNKKNYFVRANIWPSKEDYLTSINGEDAFFYHKPHDHNFNFLTVGYHGSGYWSDYYEYDYNSVIGYPGEKVDLKFIERSRLSQGKLMLYRAHVDIHDQLPAENFSISINIMENTLRPLVTDQYAIDIENKVIKKVLTKGTHLPIMRASLIFNNQNALDVIDHIACNHMLDSVRMSAVDAIALACEDLGERREVYEKYAKNGSKFVANNCDHRLKQIGNG